MERIINKLYKKDKLTLTKEIITFYENNGYCIIFFLYFAQIVSQNLFEQEQKNNIRYAKLYKKKINTLKNNTHNYKVSDYKNILLNSSFLLPDGIALQFFYFFYKILKNKSLIGTKLYNLNGTDYTEYFIEYIKQNYGKNKINLILYGSTKKGNILAKNKFQSYGYNVVYYQDGYTDFQWKDMEKKLKKYQDKINIMLVGMTSIQIPYQELFINVNQKNIQKNNLLVFGVGGLLDFIGGIQKRAPKFIRNIKLEWLRRFLSDPSRNIKKVFYSLSIFKYIFYYLVLKKQ